MAPLDTAGMHADTIEQLHKYEVSDDEIQQVLTVARAGMSEQDCVEIIRIARSRHRSFAEAEPIAGLLGAGVKESSVLELLRMEQLALFGGEAEAMHLAGISDDVVLELARRKAKGEAAVSGSRLAELRNVGFSNTELMAVLQRGTTDRQAEQAIASRKYALSGHSFVRQTGRRR